MSKKREIISKAEIKDGRMKIIRRMDFDRFVKESPNGTYQLTLKRVYRKRSINENAFYWGPFLDQEISILYDEGYHFPNKDVLHEWNKDNFSRDKLVNEGTGKIINIIMPTSGMTTIQFEEFLDNIRLTFRENYNAELPYPNE